MRNARLWRALLGVEKTVVEEIDFDEGEQVLIAHVRPTRSAVSRCGRCQRRCPRYDWVRAGAGGGAWIWARSRCIWMQTHLG